MEINKHKVSEELKKEYHVDEEDSVNITNNLLDYFEEDEVPYTVRDFVECIDCNGEWEYLYKLYIDNFEQRKFLYKSEILKQEELAEKLKGMRVING